GSRERHEPHHVAVLPLGAEGAAVDAEVEAERPLRHRWRGRRALLVQGWLRKQQRGESRGDHEKGRLEQRPCPANARATAAGAPASRADPGAAVMLSGPYAAMVKTHCDTA